MDYLEIIDRSNSGTYISEENWDLEKVATTCMGLVQKFDLKWDKQTLIPNDPALADRVFAAGFELAAEIGAYNRSSERMLHFERSELEAGLNAMQTRLTMGQGADERVLFARKIMDERAPLVWAGNPGAPHPESLFLPAVLSWAQESIVDLITCGTLAEVDGREVRTGEALEITATRRELTYLHQALARVGRPGMGMLAAQSSVSELGDLAAAHPDYLRPCDAHLIPMLNELKIDNRNIARGGQFNGIRHAQRRAVLRHRRRAGRRRARLRGDLGRIHHPGQPDQPSGLPHPAPHPHPPRSHHHARGTVGGERGAAGFRAQRPRHHCGGRISPRAVR